MKKYILIILLLILPNICLADGPSFDCKKARTCIEKFICADKDLSALDKKMSETYTNVLAKLQGDNKVQVKQNQIRWIKARDERCEEPNLRKDEEQKMVERVFFENLFTFLYRERIEELQGWEDTRMVKRPPPMPRGIRCAGRGKNWLTDNFGLLLVMRLFAGHLRRYSIPPVKHLINWNAIGHSRQVKNVFRNLIGSRLNLTNIRG